MLSKEEFQQMLAMLLAFSQRNHLSARMISKLLNVSAGRVATWLRLARSGDVGELSAYRYLAEPVIQKLTALDQLDADRGTYTAIANEKPAVKIDLLKGALSGFGV